MSSKQTEIDTQDEGGRTELIQLARGAGTNFAGKVGGRLIHFITQIVLARFLGPIGFGLYSIGWNLLRTVDIIAPLGLNFGVIRFGSGGEENANGDREDVIGVSISISTIFGLFIGLGFFLGANFIAEAFNKPELSEVIRWFSLAFPVMGGLKVGAATTRISKQMKYSVYSEELGQPLVNLILFVAFFLLGWGLLGAVGAGVVSFAFSFGLVLFFVNRLFPGKYFLLNWRKINLKALFSFSIPTAFAWMFTSFIVLIDRLFVGYFLSEFDAGIYQAVSLFSVVFVVILSAFSTIISPMIADLHHKREMKQLENIVRVSTRWGITLSVPVVLVLCFASQEVLELFFGTEYRIGYIPLIILSVANFVNVAKGSLDHLLIMTGHQRTWLRISTIILGGAFLLNWILIPMLGITGASIATLLSFLFLSLIGLNQTKRLVGIMPFDRSALKAVYSGVFAVLAVLLISSIIAFSPFVNLLIKGLVTVIVFGLSMAILGLDQSDREIILLIKGKLVSGK